ncbi:hypothetical protein HanIR_Chr10g0471601 [Helianthus annuus]|nr:hypothetical protein HanIR_Chr10g0471601 [Helianthus annuus]
MKRAIYGNTCTGNFGIYNIVFMYMSHPQNSTRGVPPLGGVTDQDQATNHIKHSI